MIGNSDRNNGNCGIIVNILKEKEPIKISTVYDNGACFYHSWDDNKIDAALHDEKKLLTAAWKGYSCIYTRNEHRLNPFHIIQEMNYEKFNNAVEFVIKNFNLNYFNDMIDELSAHKRLTPIRAELTKTLVKIRLEDVIILVFQRIVLNKQDQIKFNACNLKYTDK